MTERTTMWISFFCILVYVCVVVVVAVSFLFWGVCAGVCTFDCEQFDNDSSGGGHIYPSASVVFRLVSISFPHRLVVLWHSSSSAVECSHWKEVRIDGASILCVLFRAKTVSIPSGFIFCLFHSKITIFRQRVRLARCVSTICRWCSSTLTYTQICMKCMYF